MPHWTCPSHTDTVDTAKSVSQQHSHFFYNCVFFQWKMLSITLKKSFQLQLEVCDGNQGILATGNYLWEIICYTYQVTSRQKDAEIHHNVYVASIVFEHNKFHTYCCVKAVTSVYVDKNQNSLSVRNSNFSTHFQFSLPNLKLGCCNFGKESV